MCTRLHPDVMVANNVAVTLQRKLRRLERGWTSPFLDGWDDTEDVIIDVVCCVRNQEKYFTAGLGNLFLGYQGSLWSQADFENYLFQADDCFQPLGNGLYRYHPQDQAPFTTADAIRSALGNICEHLLLQTYEPRILAALHLGTD